MNILIFWGSFISHQDVLNSTHCTENIITELKLYKNIRKRCFFILFIYFKLIYLYFKQGVHFE